MKAAALFRAGVMILAASVPAARAGTADHPPMVVLRAADVVDSLGVNAHIAYSDTSYAAVERVRLELGYLGVRHVRNLLQSRVTEPAAGVHLDALAATGAFRFDFVSMDPDLDRTMRWLDAFATRFPGAIAAVEGPNEVDHWPIAYGALTGQDAAIQYQTDLYRLVHADPALKGVAVYGLTGLAPSRTGDLSAIMDFGNEHPYPRNGAPPSGHLPIEIERARRIAPARPMVLTETGYPTLTGHPEISFGRDGVSEDVQARSTLNLLLDLARWGIVRTYLYELMDEKPDPEGRSIEWHYGLFTSNGTAKKAADALHNFTTLLADGGADARHDPAQITVTVANLPDTGSSLVMTKRDGSYVVAVWAEPPIWDAGSGQPIAPAERKVDVAWKEPATATAYDPLLGISPLKVMDKVRRIEVTVTDHPVLIEVRPSSM